SRMEPTPRTAAIRARTAVAGASARECGKRRTPRRPPTGRRRRRSGSADSGGGLLEAVVAPEDLAIDDDARDSDDAEVAGPICGFAQRKLDRIALDRGRE